ncbi:DUF2933 domain-containing protein [Arthrobacter sp. VKM Ac-2550]|uniref:DUF2933 domain-containing protein n=1 Tax=Crystallibacter permensis TaxID=1938888 RepID=UPI002227B8C8|nr:DUF2933 domain-containing protein [Arthrobacter sp. VKM Ac-2550]
MNHNEHPAGHRPGPPPPQQPGPDRRALSVRAGLAFLIVIAVIYLLTSHWLHVLDALPYVLVVGMLGMHLFGHGGHGGHGNTTGRTDDAG